MSETLLSSRNLAFELYEVLDAEGLTQRERFAEHSRETFDAAIGTARHIATKLCRRFVGDAPTTALIDSVAAVFTAQVAARAVDLLRIATPQARAWNPDEGQQQP